MTRAQIQAICAAYELGLAAAQRTGARNPYQSDGDAATAWAIGREQGRQLAQCTPDMPDFVQSTWPEHGDGGKDAW